MTLAKTAEEITATNTERIRKYRARKKAELEAILHPPPSDFEAFVSYVKGEATKKGAKASVMGIYKELLKFQIQLKKEGKVDADAVAKRNLEAERQLRK